jgi:hypothetical protein
VAWISLADLKDQRFELTLGNFKAGTSLLIDAVILAVNCTGQD